MSWLYKKCVISGTIVFFETIVTMFSIVNSIEPTPFYQELVGI